jgi:hypothetical protein
MEAAITRAPFCFGACLRKQAGFPLRIAAYDVLAAITVVAITAWAVQHSRADRSCRRFIAAMLSLGINATAGYEAFATRAFDNPSLRGHNNTVGEVAEKRERSW